MCRVSYLSNDFSVFFMPLFLSIVRINKKKKTYNVILCELNLSVKPLPSFCSHMQCISRFSVWICSMKNDLEIPTKWKRIETQCFPFFNFFSIFKQHYTVYVMTRSNSNRRNGNIVQKNIEIINATTNNSTDKMYKTRRDERLDEIEDNERKREKKKSLRYKVHKAYNAILVLLGKPFQNNWMN